MSSEVITRVHCPHCQTAFRALPEHAGKRAKCSHCGGTIVVPGEPLKPPPPPEPVPEQPQYVGVNCLLCGTRMYGTLADVGKELKCPDCGRLTKLPPPEVKKKRIPAAMEGEQYELWEGDNQPWGVTLSAAGPHYVAVECRLCQTHLQATIDQVGKKIRCPDCGAETLVRVPATGVKTKAPPPPVDEYGVEDAVATTPLSSFYASEIDEAEALRGAGSGTKKGESKPAKAIDAPFEPRPELPRWPLVSGTLSFMRTSGVPSRWIIMSSSLVAILWLGNSALSTLGTVSGGIGGAPIAILGMTRLAAAIVVGLIWSMAMAAAALAIVSESAEGNEHVHAWPSSNFMDWIPDLLTILVALMTAAVPGYVVAELTGRTPLAPFMIGVSVLIFLPLTHLSQLVNNSAWAVFSPHVVLSWFRCPFSWIGFLLHAAIAASMAVGAGFLAYRVSPWFLFLFAPVAVEALIYYCRVMGRLAWVIAETAPIEDEEGDQKAGGL